MAAYRRADGLGHGAAVTNLGVLLAQQASIAGAEDCFRRADQRGDANGAFNLAVLLEEQGDEIGAMGPTSEPSNSGTPRSRTWLAPPRST